MRFRLVTAVVAVLITASACGSSSKASAPATNVSESTTPPTAATSSPTAAVPTVASLAAAIRARVSEVGKTVAITENNDPNNLIGRPSGYVGAEVLYDSRVTCSDGLGADCGAMIEQWPTAAAAKQRMDYIQGILAKSPALGSEYDYAVGDLLVRVAGKLKPSEAKVYAAAVGS